MIQNTFKKIHVIHVSGYVDNIVLHCTLKRRLYLLGYVISLYFNERNVKKNTLFILLHVYLKNYTIQTKFL